MMKGALITLAIGALVIIFDWHMVTKPEAGRDPKKRQPRKPLKSQDRNNLRDLALLTCGLAVGVWVWQTYFS